MVGARGRPEGIRAVAGTFRGYEISDLAGRYSFQFTGFAMGNVSKAYQIVGQGQFVLGVDGKLQGKQASGTLRLQGHGQELTFSDYELNGTATLEKSGVGTATIEFKPLDKNGTPMQCLFDIALAGGLECVWFMGKGGTVTEGEEKGETIGELVSGEARRLL